MSGPRGHKVLAGQKVLDRSCLGQLGLLAEQEGRRKSGYPNSQIREAEIRIHSKSLITCQGLRAPWLARKACIGGTKGLGLLGRPADRGGQRENPDLPTDRPGRRESGFGWEGWGKEIQMKSPHYWLTRKA